MFGFFLGIVFGSICGIVLAIKLSRTVINKAEKKKKLAVITDNCSITEAALIFQEYMSGRNSLYSGIENHELRAMVENDRLAHSFLRFEISSNRENPNGLEILSLFRMLISGLKKLETIYMVKDGYIPSLHDSRRLEDSFEAAKRVPANSSHQSILEKKISAQKELSDFLAGKISTAEQNRDKLESLLLQVFKSLEAILMSHLTTFGEDSLEMIEARKKNRKKLESELSYTSQELDMFMEFAKEAEESDSMQIMKSQLKV